MSLIHIAYPRCLKNGKVYLEHESYELVPCPMCKGFGRPLLSGVHWSGTRRVLCYLCMGEGKTEEARANAYRDAHR